MLYKVGLTFELMGKILQCGAVYHIFVMEFEEALRRGIYEPSSFK